MKQSLDLKDRKILFELDKNARISCSQIGKKIGLSTEVVNYRIKRLEENKIITQYQTEVNYKKLGLIHFKIFLRFKGIKIEIEEELYKKIEIIPQIVWIAKCRGEWDCMLSSTVESISQLDEIKDKVLHLANEHIAKKAISISSNIWSSPRKYLLTKNDIAQEMKGNKEQMDKIDIDILRTLSANARMPVIELAEKLDLTVKIVSSRLRKLIDKNIIHDYRLDINFEKLGIYFFKTFFYLKNPENERVKMLISKINSHKN
jgi:Lrp/AsnC family leucine-responsive transcriptional regulator